MEVVQTVFAVATFGMTIAILYRVLKIEKLADDCNNRSADNVSDDGYA